LPDADFWRKHSYSFSILYWFGRSRRRNWRNWIINDLRTFVFLAIEEDSQSHPVLDTPVPPELMALFNGLKEQMKKHKATMAEVTEATINIDSVDSVSGEIEKVRAEMNSLVTAIHRQELQCLALVKDIQEISKDAQLMVDLSSGGGAHTFGGLSQPVLDFIHQLIEKYSERMAIYKLEVERAEASFKVFTEASSTQLNLKDLWASLSNIRDVVILLASQVQQLNEGVRKELLVHKNLSGFFGTTTPDWIRALELELKLGGGGAESLSSLQKLKTPALMMPIQQQHPVSDGGASLGRSRAMENLHDRLRSTFGGARPRAPPVELSMRMKTPGNLQGTIFSPVGVVSHPRPQYYPSPSVMGSYLGPTSPTPGVPSQASPVSLIGHKRAHL
ncbi:Nucleoporin p58/p45, partial [Orchesella cincta]